MSLVGKKNIGNLQDGIKKRVSVVYDFAVDTGAIKDYDVLENVGGSDMLVELIYCHVETALTSATDFDIDLGVGDGGAELWSDNAKAVYPIDAVVLAATANTKVVLVNGAKIVLGVETAAITAGKMHMVFEYINTEFNT